MTMATEIETADHPETSLVSLGTAIRTIDAPAVSMLPVEQMREVLAEYDARRKTFREWLLSKMSEGVHFGVPPGCNADPNVNPRQWKARPSLYKAGADLCCDLLMMDPRFEPDMDTWKMLGSKDGTVVIRCRLVSRGHSAFFPDRAKDDVLGEGRGAGTAGVKRRDGNGAVKIAQKCAKVDAVINTLGLSDLFTQDLEDGAQANPHPDHDSTSPKVGTRAERKEQNDDPTRVSPKQLNDLFCLWQRKTRPERATTAAFEGWAKGILRLKPDVPLNKPSMWDVDALDVCKSELEAMQ